MEAKCKGGKSGAANILHVCEREVRARAGLEDGGSEAVWEI